METRVLFGQQLLDKEKKLQSSSILARLQDNEKETLFVLASDPTLQDSLTTPPPQDHLTKRLHHAMVPCLEQYKQYLTEMVFRQLIRYCYRTKLGREYNPKLVLIEMNTDFHMAEGEGEWSYSNNSRRQVIILSLFLGHNYVLCNMHFSCFACTKFVSN